MKFVLIYFDSLHETPTNSHPGGVNFIHEETHYSYSLEWKPYSDSKLGSFFGVN